MDKSVIFYGERGLINSIIFDMKNEIPLQQAFLDCIALSPNNQRLPWISKLSSMTFFVEPSFAQFGSPDLIIRATTTDNKVYIIFIEAKTTSYENAAVNINAAGFPVNGYPGNGSCINVQLAYRYRFVQAIKESFKTKKFDSIEENFLTDKNGKNLYCDMNRKLKKPNLLKFCFDFFADADDYYFVALTNDLKEKTSKKLSPIPCVGKTRWPSLEDHFGIFTYEDLIEKEVISKSSGFYKSAHFLMF